MGFSSLQVCMESSPDHWLQGTLHEESGMDSSSSPLGDIITCSRPTTEMRRLVRPPPQDQALNKCPRCDSSHTKFCYYNNYSLSQPRYFCKSCRRYWTKGGTLRNIPVGGSFRKNTKKASNSNKKSNINQQAPFPTINQNQLAHSIGGPSNYNYQDVQFSHINNLLGTSNIGGALLGNPSAMGVFENHGSMNYDFFGVNSDNVGVGYNIGSNVLAQNYQSLCSSAFGGMSLNSGSSSYDTMDSCYQNIIDVKPNPRILSLEWQDHVEGPGSWTGVTNGYGSSTTNPVV